MNNDNDIEEELRGLGSPLAGMSRLMPYEVPKDYFISLETSLSEAVQAAVYDITPGFSNDKSSPMEVPAGYFNFLPQQLLMLAKEQDVLDQLPQSVPYTVPQGYFNTLPQQTLENVQHSEIRATKRIKLTWAYTRWSAAAIFILFMGIGSYNMMHPQPLNMARTLSHVPADSINAYVQQNIDEFDIDMIENKLASSKDVQQHFDQNELKQLDKGDIIQYLNETGWNEHSEIN